MKLQKSIIIAIAALIVVGLITLGLQSFRKSEDQDKIEKLIINLKQIEKPEVNFSIDKSPQKKKFIIMHFWASWCSPCQAEMPALFAAQPKLADKFQIILISEDENPNEALAFLKKVGTPPTKDFAWIDSDKSVSGPLGIFKLPETIIYDSNFKFIRKIAGSMEWLDSKNLEYLNNL